MRAALITEYRKFVTTRMWWVLLLTMAAYMAFLAVVMAFAFTADPSAGAMEPGAMAPDGTEAMVLSARDIAMTVYTLAATFGYVFPVLVGALSVAGEFRHMTITPTLLVEPRRSVVLGAKLLAAVPLGLVFGLVGTVFVAGPGALVLQIMGSDPLLSDPDVLRTLGFSVLAMAIWAPVGVGFGAALKNQVAAIVVVLAFTQLVEPIIRFAGGLAPAFAGVPKWLPGAAGEAVVGSSMYSVTGLNELLNQWQGALVLIGYAVVFAAIGRFTTLNRDIT